MVTSFITLLIEIAVKLCLRLFPTRWCGLKETYKWTNYLVTSIAILNLLDATSIQYEGRGCAYIEWLVYYLDYVKMFFYYLSPSNYWQIQGMVNISWTTPHFQSDPTLS